MFQKFRGKNRPKIISIQKKTDVPSDSTQDATESVSAGSIVRRAFTLGAVSAGLVSLYMGISSCGNKVLNMLGFEVSEAPASTHIPQETPEGYDPDLVAAAYLEQKVTVYTPDSDYIQKAASAFEALFGIVVDYQVVSVDEMGPYLNVNSDDGKNLNPSPIDHPIDSWFFVDTEHLNQAGAQNLLASYDAQNKEHLLKPIFVTDSKLWYGIATDPLIIAINKERLDVMGLAHPHDWNDLLSTYLRDQIVLPEYEKTHDGNSFAVAMIGNLGIDQGIAFLKELSTQAYKAFDNVRDMLVDLGLGRALVTVCQASEALYALGHNDFDNVMPLLPFTPTHFTTYGVAISSQAKHPNAARLWVEFCLSTEFASEIGTTGSYMMPTISGVKAPWYMDRIHLNGAVSALREAPQALDNTGKVLSTSEAGKRAQEG
ncbi:ABC transporter substrate-binding protein [Lancefieldella rimae]|uniref:ABC transporter substrate-binding protein n=1 Tax=Lancefieldella rimae TaxID=1383 RepID=UPI001CB215DA|nr:extracellular solute-binding protein [Lancefieldella rimae]MBF4804020.1 extracellular solute-binding protein [Lancefieldella rimae]